MRTCKSATRMLLVGLNLTVLVSAGAGFAGQAKPVEGTPAVLSVGESVGAAFLYDPRRPGPTAWHIYSRVNPKARGLLLKMLADKGLWKAHAAAIRMLGYVGNAEDAKVLLERMEKITGVVQGPDVYTVEATFECLALMSRRKVSEADAIIGKLAKLDYWKKSKLRWSPEGRSTTPYECEGVARFMHGCRLLADRDKLSALVAPVLKGVSGERLRKYLNWRMGPDRLAERGKRILAAEKKAVGEKDREQLRALCRRNFGPLEGEKSGLTAGDLEFLRKTRAEALKEYEGFKKLVLGGKFDELRDHLLDNRERIGEDRLKSSWASYRRGLEDHQKTLLEELEKVECKPANFRIERKAIYREVPSGKAGKTREVVKEEFLLVTFELEGTAAFGRKHFRNVADWRMFRPDRTLKVLLRKEGGKWYWNPFGW